MAKPKIIILGAGISGLSLGWKLASEGIEVEILESKSEIGGLAGTVREGPYALDYGPHSFFSEDKHIQTVFHDLFGGGLPPLKRRVKFHYRGQYLNYPFTPSTIFFQMGLTSGIKASLSFLKEKLFPHKQADVLNDDQSVEDWAISSFGQHLYQSFFKPYTEQFWKIPCSELSARSIPSHTRTSFVNTLKLLINRKVSKQGSTLIERERLPTYYPTTGYGELPDRVAEEFVGLGGKIHTASQAREVTRTPDGNMKVKYLNRGEELTMEGDYVVSTIALRYFLQMLKPEVPADIFESAQTLDYRPLLVLGMVTEKQNVLGGSMYVYQMNRPYNRIFECNQFSPCTSPEGENIIGLEISCLRNSVAWNATEEELFEMCINSLSEDGFLSPGDVKKLILVKAPYAYPIYRKHYVSHLNRVLDYIRQQEGIHSLGRLGEFMYMDADKCMSRAFNFADQFLAQQAMTPSK